MRAANTGISAVIDPLGRYVGRLARGTEGVLQAALPGALGLTPYAAIGDWTMILVLIISLGIVISRAFREKK